MNDTTVTEAGLNTPAVDNVSVNEAGPHGAAVNDLAVNGAAPHEAEMQEAPVDTAVLIAQLTTRLEQVEAPAAIRTVMANYMRLCDGLDESTPMDELADLFTADAVWTGKGARYEAAFGAHHGRAAIIAMLDIYRSPPHFAFNAHFLTSESIEVAGRMARGRWLMLQTSTYSGGTSDLRSARLTVDFARDADRWRISRFETENLASRSIDRWHDATPVPVPAPQTTDRGVKG